MVDSQSFLPAVSELWKSSIKDSLAGFASINYRLSPYPSHPDKPSSPGDLSRNVHHPCHLQDVGHALLHLEKKYQIANRYLLVGHSAGATIAFELHNWYFPHKSLPLPAAVLGVAGIYHFEAFVEAHKEISVYKQFMENAFPDISHWKRASPCTSELPGEAIWEQIRTVIISHSDQDELIEEGQAKLMLERARKLPASKEKVHFLEARGNHDEIWGSGVILAGVIIESLKVVQLAS